MRQTILFFFLNWHNKRNMMVWFLTTLKKGTFKFNPCANCFVTPWLTVQEVTRQQYKTLILDLLLYFDIFETSSSLINKKMAEMRFSELE